MGKVSWGIAVGAVALALIAGRFGQVFYRRAEKFEAQARLALANEHVRQTQVDLLTDQVNGLQVKLRSQHAQTQVRREQVTAVDAASPPDTYCAPNIAARDAVIDSQDTEIASLHGIVDGQAGQINLLQASKDELRRALEARPKLYPRIVGPSIGVGVFAGIVGVKDNGRPALGVGIGVTINVFSVRL
jgi:hypothetical protein